MPNQSKISHHNGCAQFVPACRIHGTICHPAMLCADRGGVINGYLRSTQRHQMDCSGRVSKARTSLLETYCVFRCLGRFRLLKLIRYIYCARVFCCAGKVHPRCGHLCGRPWRFLPAPVPAGCGVGRMGVQSFSRLGALPRHEVRPSPRAHRSARWRFKLYRRFICRRRFIIAVLAKGFRGVNWAGTV